MNFYLINFQIKNLNFNKNFKLKILNFISLTPHLTLAIILTYGMISYLHIYYVHYPKRTDPDWSGGYKEAIEYAVANESKYDAIAITDEMSWGYVYLYFYGPFNPQKINSTPDNHYQFGKYKFVDMNFRPEKGTKTLYIAPHWRDKFEGRELNIIRNRGNDVVFRVFEIWEN